jgi:hypothetical protein
VLLSVALLKCDVEEWLPNAPALELDAVVPLKCECSMFETARLLETVDALLVLRLLVAAESDVEPRAPLEFAAGAVPRELFAKVLEFVPPRAADPVVEFAGPLRPMYGEAVVPRLPADAAEPLLYVRAEFAPGAPKCALEGGATPARLPAL